jgi:proteasome alpha subunit
MLTPYDFQENVQQRAQYILNRLREGSPVVGISSDDGLMLLSMKRKGRKIFEVYDRLMCSAMGHQADIENLRLAAIDFAHQEGFVRSPDDVTIQRVVGFALSPALKKAFGDALVAPFVVRALFAELGSTPEKDVLYTLNYDGEFAPFRQFAVIAGSVQAEDTAMEHLEVAFSGKVPTLEKAIPAGMIAWGMAREAAQDEYENSTSESDARLRLKDELRNAELEVGLLERNTTRENRFRLVPYETLQKYIEHL